MFDGTILEPLDSVKSPVLEYSSLGILDGELLVENEFYSCSNDLDFSKKVSNFFRKLKKELIFVKKYRLYVSLNIDLSTAKFYGDKIITEEDLSKANRK